MIARFFLTFAALVIPFLFFVFLGCIKTPEHKADYGPEVSEDEVDEALYKLGTPSPLLIEKGEFAYSVYSQAIDTGASRIVGQQGSQSQIAVKMK